MSRPVIDPNLRAEVDQNMITPNGSRPVQRKEPEPLAEEAYHGVAGDIVRAIKDETEADPAAILVQLLVYFGNACGRGPGFVGDGKRHYLNEFVAIVGLSGAGGRKGTSEARAREPMRLADEELERRLTGGLNSDAGLIERVRDAKYTRREANDGDDPDRVDDDGLVHEVKPGDEGVADKRLAIFEPELSSVFEHMGRQGNALTEVLCQAWDGDPLSSLTRNSSTATGTHISLVGHTTPANLTAKLTHTDMANGFGNRFVWLFAKRSNRLPDGGNVTIDRTLVNRLKDALSATRQLGVFERDMEAKELWHGVYDRLTAERPGLLGELCSRAEAHTMRLAVMFAVLDRERETVRLEHLQAALAVWDYSERSIGYLFGDRIGNPDADTILAALRRAAGRGMTRTDIHGLFGRNRGKGQIDQALAELLSRELARYEMDGKTERWFAAGGVS